MVKRGDLVFAQVKGHSPWPAKILNKVSSNQFRVIFFGTKQEGVVKKTRMWNYEENLEKFSSKYGSRRLYSLALEEVNKAKIKKQTKDNPGKVDGTKNKAKMKKRIKAKQEEAYGTKELVFAKVKGYSPWPAQIIEKLSPKIYNVFFFGTSQTGKVKKENIWKYDAKREEFNAKYGKRNSYTMALNQIREVASLLPSESTKKKPLASSKTAVRNEASEEIVAMFVDDEDLPKIREVATLIPSKSTNKKPLAASKTAVRNEASEEIVAMLVDDEDLPKIREVATLLPSKSTNKKPLAASKTVIRSEASEETVTMFVDDEDIPKISNNISDENDNDHPVIIYDSRASNTPTKELDKDQTESSVDVFEVPCTNGNITERNDEQIEEIQRNDSFFVIKNFSITWPISFTNSRNSF